MPNIIVIDHWNNPLYIFKKSDSFLADKTGMLEQKIWHQYMCKIAELHFICCEWKLFWLNSGLPYKYLRILGA